MSLRIESKEDLDRQSSKDMKPLKKVDGFDILGPRMVKEICDDRWFPCCGLFRLYARLGLHRYNLLQGTNLQLSRVEKYTKTTHALTSDFYITLVAMDPASSKLLTFQTKVGEKRYGKLILMCRIARPLGANTDDDGRTSYYYKPDLCNVPKSPPEDLFENRKRFYVVKKSELQHNDWIRLYLELTVATSHRSTSNNLDLSNLKIEKVAIETTTEDMEPPNEGSLNALNAIVYIRYKDFCEARVGKDVDRIAIVRRTFDQHIRCFILEGLNQKSEIIPKKGKKQAANLLVSRRLGVKKPLRLSNPGWYVAYKSRGVGLSRRLHKRRSI